MIRSHSLHEINIVFLFKEGVLPPANGSFLSIWTEAEKRGFNFIEDTVMQTKFCHVPALKLGVIWEGRRLRIEDQEKREPGESGLLTHALRVYDFLATEARLPLAGFGFNFELFYQFTQVIPLQTLFAGIATKPLLEIGEELLDLGWQWTVSKGDGRETSGYSVKIAAPIEIAVHRNAHFIAETLPSPAELEKLFSRTYAETHQTIRGLALN